MIATCLRNPQNVLASFLRPYQDLYHFSSIFRILDRNLMQTESRKYIEFISTRIVFLVNSVNSVASFLYLSVTKINKTLIQVVYMNTETVFIKIRIKIITVTISSLSVSCNIPYMSLAWISLSSHQAVESSNDVLTWITFFIKTFVLFTLLFLLISNYQKLIKHR